MSDSISSRVSPEGVGGPDCPFCVEGLDESMIVDQDERTISLMHPEPATDGHALVVPRRHVVDLYEIASEDLTATIGAAQRLAVRQRDRLGAEGVNLLNACRPAGWQTIFHFHIHVVPRYAEDGLQPPWTPHPGDRGKIETLAAVLRGR